MNSNKEGSFSGGMRSTQVRWGQRRFPFWLVLGLACSLTAARWEALAAPPVITVARTSPVVMSWPTNFPGFGLQTKTNLSPGAVWESCALKPVVVGTNYLVTNTFTESMRLFRLSDLPLRYCRYNLGHIGNAMRVWAMDNLDRFPFHVPIVEGGTMEWRAIGPDGFDTNSFVHFMVLSNELVSTSVLICPSDLARQPATTFTNLRPENLTYRLRTGPTVSDTYPEEVLAVCPIDGNTLYCDGSVKGATQY